MPTHHLAAPCRVVSLVASNTEIVCALGLGERLVGVDDYSDWPTEVVAHLPRVGRDLDIDLERVRRLEPDLVLASLSVPGMERNVERLATSGLPYAVVEARGFSGVLDSIRQVAGLLGAPERGDSLAAGLQQRMSAVASESAQQAGTRPRVYWEWWPRPPITAGAPSWVTDMLRLAGGENVFADLERESAPVEVEEVARRQPDVVVLCYCGARKLPDPSKVRERTGWSDTPAVRDGRLHAVLEPLFGRPGPRLVEGLEQLAGLLRT